MNKAWMSGAVVALCAAGIAVAADTKDKEKEKAKAQAAAAPKATTAPKATDKANQGGIILQNQGAKGSDKAIILQNQGAKAPAADAAKKSTKAATPGS